MGVDINGWAGVKRAMTGASSIEWAPLENQQLRDQLTSAAVTHSNRYHLPAQNILAVMHYWAKHNRKVNRLLADGETDAAIEMITTYGHHWCLDHQARGKYNVADLHWYTASQVESLLHLVFGVFDGFGMPDMERGVDDDSGRRSNRSPRESGDLWALVLDVRKGLSRAPAWVGAVLRNGDDTAAMWRPALLAVVDELGGLRPAGRR